MATPAIPWYLLGICLLQTLVLLLNLPLAYGDPPQSHHLMLQFTLLAEDVVRDLYFFFNFPTIERTNHLDAATCLQREALLCASLGCFCQRCDGSGS